MPYYESVLVARQEIGGGDAERLGEHYEELLTKEGASVVRREYWGLRRLAYRVRKNRKGHYLMLQVDGPGAAIQEYERQLRIDENVIRYLTMRLEQLPEGPSIIMKARSEREERRDQENARREEERKKQAAEKEGEPADGTAPAEGAAPAGDEDAKPEGAAGGDAAPEAEAQEAGAAADEADSATAAAPAADSDDKAAAAGDAPDGKDASGGAPDGEPAPDDAPDGKDGKDEKGDEQ